MKAANRTWHLAPWLKDLRNLEHELGIYLRETVATTEEVVPTMCYKYVVYDADTYYVAEISLENFSIDKLREAILALDVWEPIAHKNNVSDDCYWSD